MELPFVEFGETWSVFCLFAKVDEVNVKNESWKQYRSVLQQHAILRAKEKAPGLGRGGSWMAQGLASWEEVGMEQSL